MQQIKQYGYADTNLTGYEEDHLISLALGGVPRDPTRNTAPNNASTKDRLEDVLHKMVCAGQVPLDTARQEISFLYTDITEKSFFLTFFFVRRGEFRNIRVPKSF